MGGRGASLTEVAVPSLAVVGGGAALRLAVRGRRGGRRSGSGCGGGGGGRVFVGSIGDGARPHSRQRHAATHA